MNTLADFMRPDDPPDYGTHWDKIHPQYFQLITQLMTQFALIDIGISAFFGSMFGNRAYVAINLYRDQFQSGQRMAASAARTALTAEQFEFFEAIQQFSSSACSPRNSMAHGVWMWSPYVGDAGILLISPKGYMALNAQFQARRQGSRLSREKEELTPANIPVYSRDDFVAILQSVGHAVDAWLRLAAWIDPENAPSRFRDPVRELHAMEPVMNIVRGNRERPVKIQDRLDRLASDWRFKQDVENLGNPASTLGWVYGQCADELRAELKKKG